MKIRNVSLGYFNSYMNCNPHITPEVGVAIAQSAGNAIGSIVGGIVNGRSARKNRALQKYMFDADQAWQREQYDRTEQFNWDMWNAQNAYNDPRAQAERYLSAGLNPALVMGNAGQNVATSGNSLPPGSSSPIPSMQPIDYSWIRDAMTALGRIATDIQDYKLKDEELKRSKIQTDNFEATIRADLEEKRANAASGEAKAAYTRLLEQFDKDTYETRKDEQISKAKEAQENAARASAERITAEVTAKMTQMRGEAFPAFLDQELRNLIAEEQVKLSVVNLNKASAKYYASAAATQVAQKAMIEAQTHGIKFDNEMYDNFKQELYYGFARELETKQQERNSRWETSKFIENNPGLSTILGGAAGLLGGTGAAAGGIGQLLKAFIKP